ncbi:MAG TPA: precorrin-3B synthase [Rhizobiaceae bacterium]|nr:precorrin-3B synthase [Rhizobiaceae bacterium]
MNAPMRRGACPSLSRPMQTGDGLLVRLRPLTGGVSPEQVGGLADAAARYGSGILEVTRRGNLQIRGLTVESAVDLAKAVNVIGIDVMSGVPIETGPLAGLDAWEVADPRPLARAIREGITETGLASQLGPKVSVVVDGGGALPMDDVAADIRLAARREGGWLVSVGGMVREAGHLGAVAEGGAAQIVISLLDAIAAKGLRGRGRDLSSEDLYGISQHPTLPPSVLPDISPPREEPSLPVPPISTIPGKDAAVAAGPVSPPVGEMSGRTEGGNVERRYSPVGCFGLNDGSMALGMGLPFGQAHAETLKVFAEKAAAYGASEMRFAPGRALLAVGLATEGCERLKEAALALGFVTDPADPRLSIAACAGSPACASAFIDTKAIAANIARSAADLLDGSFILHVSGCPKGCARPPDPSLSLIGIAPGKCDALLDGREDGAIAQAGGGDAAAFVEELALLFRQRRWKGETAKAFVDRLGRVALASALRKEK